MPCPTGRFHTFWITALILYFTGNQTQVQWLYVTSALVAAVIPVAYWLNRRAVRDLSAKRELHSEGNDGELHEGDALAIALAVQAPHASRAQITVTEACPLADPADSSHEFSVFLPSLPRGNAANIHYELNVYQRGRYAFPSLRLASKAPFGLFARRGKLAASTEVLVYPEVRPLEKLDLLDRQLAAQMMSLRAGVGGEVIGVRPYRSGDSPRHIHWRSTARTGKLVSKEFAEETQPGISLVLDRCLLPSRTQHPKHNPFEWNVKALVSIAEYAWRKRYPIYLHADDSEFAVPHGAVTWDALMQWSARVPSRGSSTLADLLLAGGFRQFVAVMISQPTDDLIAPLIGLHNRGVNLLVVVPNAATFPAGGNSSADFVAGLRAQEIDALSLRYGEAEDWAGQLAVFDPLAGRVRTMAKIT